MENKVSAVPFLKDFKEMTSPSREITPLKLFNLLLKRDLHGKERIGSLLEHFFPFRVDPFASKLFSFRGPLLEAVW